MKCRPSEDVCLEHCLPLVTERTCADGCLHENADHIKHGERMDFDVDARPSNLSPCEQFRCVDCGAWLSLGPSNDAIPPAEMRLAAMLACHFADDRPCRCFDKRKRLDRATEREVRDAVEEAIR
jgi:hypothetical protein